MKTKLFSLILGVLLMGCMSCSSYYYSFLDSKDRADQRNSTNDFVQENDTVCVIYSFFGENAPIQITIHNKLEEPLYVDWGRSAIVIDDVATSYQPDAVSVQRDLNMSEAGLAKGVSFIPPKSRIVNTPLVLENFPFDKIPKKAYDKVALAKANSKMVNVHSITFTEEDTPLWFRSFLTVHTGSREGVPQKEMFLERSFYISQLIKGGSMGPSNLAAANNKDGNFFYTHTKKGEKAGLVFGVIGVSAAGIALEAAFGPMEY